MSLDGAVLAFGAFVSFIVASGIVLALYAPADREESRRDSSVRENEAAPRTEEVR